MVLESVLVSFFNIWLAGYPNIWISSNEVDETAAYYTEGTKLEREPSIHYVNEYIWT